MRARFPMEHALRMKLDTQHESIAGPLDGFDDAIGCGGRDAKGFGDLLERLVVRAVDLELG